MYIKVTYVLLFILLFFGAKAQQIEHYTINHFDRGYINPAYAGLQGNPTLNARLRVQWFNLGNGQLLTSQNINADMPLFAINSGVGITINNDLIGVQRRSSVKLNYSYSFKSEKFLINSGVSAGLSQYELDGSQLIAPEGEYSATINHNDNFIPTTKQSALAPAASVGLYAKYGVVEAGVTAQNLLTYTYELANGMTLSQNRHYSFFSKAILPIGSFDLEPSVMIYSNAKVIQQNFSFILTYNNNIWIGSAFRGYNKSSFDALSVIAGLGINNIKISYAYDFGLSDLRYFNDGSHEIALQMNFENFIKQAQGKTIYVPRDL